ncbi:diaminopimelate dehydrogenase [Lederbergia citrea]|uniref:diaminopimelate dehydrogenase n=1 Tax=Lederbergia citrea TaxID=2833581 RepID=UPI001BCA18C5|nr:diaminopimelate dehydrogenase [Lederbergia citrea]MBS4177324.1 diaminopimelate dehydrogenase [Lederbergia citrea]
MDKKIRIGITGYGNLGKGVEAAIKQNHDLELVAVFSRRDPASVGVKDPNIKVLPISEAENYKNDIDVMILCGGSATDLPEQGPAFATHFNTIDSYDTHAKIPAYFATMNQAAKSSGKTSIISVGWDPGMFSMNRLLGEAILPVGETYTFWGKGLSQGHSDAVRRVDGVKAAVQYTIPIEEAVNRVRNGENPELSTKEKHLRECFVVAEEGADKSKIEETIKTMPHYFSDYQTKVNFITEEELHANHSKMMHGGFVIRSGETGSGNNQIVEYSLKLDSNPEYTASVLTAYARAAYKMNQEGQAGAKTVFDVPIGHLSPKSPAQLRKELL